MSHFYHWWNFDRRKADPPGYTNAPTEKNKKRCLQIFREFSGVFQQILAVQEIVLSSSQGLANFRGLEASRPRPRTWKCVLEAKNVLEDSTSANWSCMLTDPDRNYISKFKRFRIQISTCWILIVSGSFNTWTRPLLLQSLIDRQRLIFLSLLILNVWTLYKLRDIAQSRFYWRNEN